MRPITAILTVVLIGLIIGCDGDDGTTGPDGRDPPEPGYLWEVWEDHYLAGGFPLLNISKYSVPDIKEITNETAPFYGRGYDAARGNGRLWVAATEYIDEYTSQGVIWEVGRGYYPLDGVAGLTWDGTRLWGSSGNYFYTINTYDYEYELKFIYGDESLIFTGLAWDGECIWAIAPANNEIIRINPENGTKVHSVLCPGKYPNGLTWDGEALLVSDRGINGSIYRISPDDGEVLCTYYTGRKSQYDINGGLAFETAK
jgi:hypothetical protein